MEPFKFSPEQRETYRAEHAPNATDAQWSFFIAECERRQLIPGVHVVFKLKLVDEWRPALSSWVKVAKVVLITTVNALRLIAERTGKFEGYGNTMYHYLEGTTDAIERNIPVNGKLFGVSVEGYRAGWKKPVFFFARFDAYAQKKDDGTLTSMWETRGPEQNAKCAEAGMLRMIAPEECGGLYIAEEFDKDTVLEKSTSVPVSATLPEARVAPVVNQEPGKVETTVFDPKTIPPVDPALKAILDADAKRREQELAQNAANAKACTAEPVKQAPTARKAPQPPKAPKAPLAAPSLPVQPETAAAGTPSLSTNPGGNTEAPSAVITGQEPAPQPTSQPKPVPAPPAPPTAKPAAVEGEDVPFEKAEYTKFLEGRCAKLVRDRLDKAAPNNKGGNLLRDYLHKVTGQKLQHIGRLTYERLISELEAMTPEAAIEFLKGAAK
jgi:hypothetical protein